MPPKTERVISFSDRSWVRREYQQFCGRYELDETSGLYFDSDTPSAHRKLISRNFLELPRPLREAALYLGLTVSTTSNRCTVSGNQSAVYGDWERQDNRIMPHLEMSASSLSSALSLPHLVHECCHLFWAVQSKAAKLAYIDQMVALVERFGADDFVEVTGYAQDYFEEWRKLINADGYAIATRRNRALEKWAMESFCESVAKICCPSYKQDEARQTDELLQERLRIMREEFNFDPARRLAAA
ncbi:MAG: hypothetical protein JST44_22750 [Cyanobacteria bacterium SZAS LIN-5]|nr:hypothetical protein [Cyanobacteria bacterium SZAS LIN-5]